jgi:hypothetical protein
MSFDLQTTPQVLAVNPAMARQHAIYLETQRSDRRIQKARNVADLLERGHRSKPSEISGSLVDLLA